MTRRLWMFWIVLALGGGVLSGFVVPTWAEEKTPDAPPAESAADDKAIQDDYELLSVLVDTLDQVERNYVKDISRRELLEAAIEGVLEKLDPYSSYISQEDMSQFRTSVESSFGGIGIQITLEGGQLKVLSPLVGTPAYRAGMQAGDHILEINGRGTEGITIDEAVKRLKGEAGSDVTVTFQHAHGGDPVTATIQREVIQVETVLGDTRKADDRWDYMLDPERKIGYLRITAFSRDTAADVRRALHELTDQGMRALVLDLRFNPGGLLTSAIEISDLFISEGKIVSTEGRNSKPRVWEAEKDGTFEDFPMVVLVNRYSASASEIVSACLQDHGRALVIGERTWGKGSVQNVIELEGGRSALKLTTASYQRPNGHKIHRFPDDDDEDEWGVLPNDGYEIKLNPAELRRLVEYRHDRDILIAHAAESDHAPPTEKPADEDKPAEEPKADDSEKPSEEKKSDKAPKTEEAPKADESTPAVDEPKSDGESDQSKSPEVDAKPDAEKPADEAPPTDEAPAAEESESQDREAANGSYVDQQLEKALEYLRGQLDKEA